MKRGLEIAAVLASCLVAAPGLRAQAPADKSAAGTGQSNAEGKNAAGTPAQASPQTGSNPFPEDTGNVPVMPSKLTEDVAPGTFSETDNAAGSLPEDDLDPVKSPDQAGDESGNVQVMESTSAAKDLDSLLPKPGEDEPGKKKGAIEEAPTETAKEDISVGKYYLDNKNWKAALSRFQSAMVLAPEEPDVYWGLAESNRHLGNLADARANYLKVIDYDPGSKHAKDAKKALDDPQIENAKAGAK